MTAPQTIAIDGPAASGKSTLGAALAERLGYTYFDSGVIYRALTWLAQQQGIDIQNAAALAVLGEQMDLQVARSSADDGRQYTVLVNGEDVTWAIRSPAVDRDVSAGSAHPAVRTVLTDRLRRLAAGGGMVMVGRDIGTVVLPEADLKVYVTASADERARRRCRDLEARGLTADYDSILTDLHRRDAIDGGRAAAPMRPAEGAHLLDTNGLRVEEEVDWVVRQLPESHDG